MCVSKDTFSSESGVKQLNSSVGPFVTCRVCQNAINIADKDNQYVVKCLHCNEATVSIFIKLIQFYYCSIVPI